MVCIEVSPLFKIQQENNQKIINPLGRIFKATDNTVTEHHFVPLNLQHLNRNRYERIDAKKNNFIPESKAVFLLQSVPVYQPLPPELHKFEYVY